MTITARIEPQGIQCSPEGWEHHAYKVTLRDTATGRQMTTSYSTGMAIADEPTAPHVLAAVIRDAQYADGDDRDPDDDPETIAECRRQAARLERLLGEAVYAETIETDPDEAAAVLTGTEPADSDPDEPDTYEDPDALVSVTREHTRADGSVIVGRFALVHHQGNKRPYFSATYEEWRSRRDLNRHRRTGSEAGMWAIGAMGPETAALFGELAVVERLHLADDTGAPMHAEANGWYFLSGEAHAHERVSSYLPDPTDTPTERAARTLRVDVDEIPDEARESREAFAAYVETLRPRWQEEADRARALLADE